MPGISVHVIGVTRGLPAAGLVVEVYALDGGPGGRTRIGGGPLSARGTLEDPGLAAAGRGLYEAVFHVEWTPHLAQYTSPYMPDRNAVQHRRRA